MTDIHNLCRNYGVVPQVITLMGYPLRSLVLERIASLNPTLVVVDRYASGTISIIILRLLVQNLAIILKPNSITLCCYVCAKLGTMTGKTPNSMLRKSPATLWRWMMTENMTWSRPVLVWTPLRITVSLDHRLRQHLLRRWSSIRSIAWKVSSQNLP